MRGLKEEEVKEVQNFIDKQEFRISDLQSDLLDHICCDIESHMSEGLDFNEAFARVQKSIPKNQLRKIELEAMETLNGQSKLSQVLTFFSFALLVLATLFKILHLPGTGLLLILSISSFAITLLLNLLVTPLIREKSRGRAILISFTISLFVFITSIFLQTVNSAFTHLFRTSGVVSSTLILGGYAIYSYLNPDSIKRHILIIFIENMGFQIEKVMMVLFAFGFSLVLWGNDYLYMIYFMLLFSIGGMFYFLKSLNYYQVGVYRSFDKLIILVVSICAFICYFIPTMQFISGQLRVTMIWTSFLLTSTTIAIHYFYQSKENQKLLLGFSSSLVALVSAINVMSATFLYGTEQGQLLQDLLYNPLFLIIFFALFLIYFKRPVFRGLMLISIGMFVVSYYLPGV